MACLKCGSKSQVEGVQVLDRAEMNQALHLQVRVDREPEAMFFKDSVDTGVNALACGECGFLEIYARNPGWLVRAAASRDRKRKKSR